jgi:WhiB family redox-sensing transcriptional regulator
VDARCSRIATGIQDDRCTEQFLERGKWMCTETADRRSPIAVVDEPRETPSFVARPPVDRIITTRARCYDPRGLYTNLFHSDDQRDIARAKAICARCTVREPCLARAIERVEPCGVWGGELLVDGAIAAYPRRRGRRPKSLAPVVVDEITGLADEPIADAV